jgi:very-short-patch-repair endonuclease
MVEGFFGREQKMNVGQARALRKSMTAPELSLRSYLRTRPRGMKVRRQHPHGPYIFDFFCSAAALAIEVDGMAHDMGGSAGGN